MQIEYEKNCCDLRWHIPVSVLLGHSLPEDIHGPYEALNCLTHRWPEERGEHYERARQLCMAAMGRRIPAEIVREAFVAASGEAGLLVLTQGDLTQGHDSARDAGRPAMS